MNIMLITPSLHHGGAERVVCRLASALCEEHRVWVVCIWPQGNEQGIYPIDPRVRIISLYLKNPFYRLQWEPAWYLARCRQRKLALRELKEKYAIDVSISFQTLCNSDNIRSRRGEKTVISVRNIMRTPVPKYWLWRWMDTVQCIYAGRRADRTVTVSRNVGTEQNRYYHVPRKRIRTIYNPVDAETVFSASREPVTDPVFNAFRRTHGFLFLTAGRMVDQKGHWHLIRAFREVHARFPDTGLVILGTGYLEDLLKTVIAANGLEDHVLLNGFHTDPFSRMGKADAFVMSSVYEGFSNAALEAMACGLPVVLTDCNSGPRELCAPDTDPSRHTQEAEQAPYGILSPVCSGRKELCAEPPEPAEEQLAEGMCALRADPALCRHYAGQSRLRAEDFSTGRILGEWEALLRELCGEAGGRTGES